MGVFLGMLEESVALYRVWIMFSNIIYMTENVTAA
jgi:hypothetical protein